MQKPISGSIKKLPKLKVSTLDSLSLASRHVVFEGVPEKCKMSRIYELIALGQPLYKLVGILSETDKAKVKQASGYRKLKLCSEVHKNLHKDTDNFLCHVGDATVKTPKI
jgi:hypothetical protein